MMRLRHSHTSPFVRKVLMVAWETGLTDRLETVPTDVWSPGTDIRADNPLGKVPALTLEDGTVLYDSPVICEYLDSLHAGRPLFPPAGPARWQALRRQALADGLCDAAVLRLLEGRRPETERSPGWVERQRTAVAKACDTLEAEAAQLAVEEPTIGEIAILAALGYLDLRFAEDEWRRGRPQLAGWFERAADRDSFRRTAPPQG